MQSSALPSRAAAWSLGIAVAVLGLKLVAWKWTGSVALYSDALESLVNVGAAATALLALRYSARPADENHPYGHTKIEYFSAVLEGILIVAAALAIVRAAAPRFSAPTPPDLTAIGIGCSVAATGINGLLSWFLVRTGRRHRSPALVADGHHVFSDVVTSAGVLLGLALGVATGRWWLDPLIAVLVAANILFVGWRLVRSSFGGLMDEGLEPEDLARLRPALEGAMTGAIEIHGLRSRRAGPTTFLEFHLVVPKEMTIARAHEICDRLEEEIERILPGAQPAIHVEPEGEAAHGSFVLRAHR